ncbi:MAG: hypothetical protein ACK5OC_02975, partial [Pirellula sp.]
GTIGSASGSVGSSLTGTYGAITIQGANDAPVGVDDTKRKKIKAHAQQLRWTQRNSVSNAKTIGSRNASDGEFVISTTVKASKDGTSHE